jgi:hypothetical protein
MSVNEFAACVQALSSPYTDPDTRKSADRWLTEFKASSDAWAVTQQCLAPPGAGVDAGAELRWYASQVLVCKVKRQLHEVADPDQRQALLDTTAAQAAAASPAEGSLRRALCVALAQLVIQCDVDAANPLLERLGASPCAPQHQPTTTELRSPEYYPLPKHRWLQAASSRGCCLSSSQFWQRRRKTLCKLRCPAPWSAASS